MHLPDRLGAATDAKRKARWRSLRASGHCVPIGQWCTMVPAVLYACCLLAIYLYSVARAELFSCKQMDCRLSPSWTERAALLPFNDFFQVASPTAALDGRSDGGSLNPSLFSRAAPNCHDLYLGATLFLAVSSLTHTNTNRAWYGQPEPEGHSSQAPTVSHSLAGWPINGPYSNMIIMSANMIRPVNWLDTVHFTVPFELIDTRLGIPAYSKSIVWRTSPTARGKTAMETCHGHCRDLSGASAAAAAAAPESTWAVNCQLAINHLAGDALCSGH